MAWLICFGENPPDRHRKHELHNRDCEVDCQDGEQSEGQVKPVAEGCVEQHRADQEKRRNNHDGNSALSVS